MKSTKAMKVAAELSQFIASAHTPYHSASNSNGQPPSSATASPSTTYSGDLKSQTPIVAASTAAAFQCPLNTSIEVPSFSASAILHGNSSSTSMDTGSYTPTATSSSTSQEVPKEYLEAMKHDPSFPSSILGINKSNLNYKVSDRGVPFPVGKNDANRLDVLQSLLVVDTDAQDASFDNVTRLACLLLGVPIALVSLVSHDKQWFKSRQGLAAGETPRDVALCNYVVLEDSAEVVQMLPFRDPILSRSPLVQSLPIGFYGLFPSFLYLHCPSCMYEYEYINLHICNICSPSARSLSGSLTNVYAVM